LVRLITSFFSVRVLIPPVLEASPAFVSCFRLPTGGTTRFGADRVPAILSFGLIVYRLREAIAMPRKNLTGDMAHPLQG
jgi:hypothetical protein